MLKRGFSLFLCFLLIFSLSVSAVIAAENTKKKVPEVFLWTPGIRETDPFFPVKTRGDLKAMFCKPGLTASLITQGWADNEVSEILDALDQADNEFLVREVILPVGFPLQSMLGGKKLINETVLVSGQPAEAWEIPLSSGRSAYLPKVCGNVSPGWSMHKRPVVISQTPAILVGSRPVIKSLPPTHSQAQIIAGEIPSALTMINSSGDSNDPKNKKRSMSTLKKGLVVIGIVAGGVIAYRIIK